MTENFHSAKKLGILVVGQSRRPEVDALFSAYLPGVEIDQRGCLDGLSRDQIEQLAPSTHEKMLFTRLPDGTGVRLSKSAVVEHGTKQLDNLLAEGADAVVVLCTGSFPDWENRKALFPSRILRHFVQGLLPAGRLFVFSPDEKQVADAMERWSALGYEVYGHALSPNASLEQIEAVRRSLSDDPPDLIVFDCVSYLPETKRIICNLTGIPGILAISAISRIVAEYLDAE